jgi:hypothetical protein
MPARSPAGVSAFNARSSRGRSAAISSGETAPTDSRHQPESSAAPNAENGTIATPAALSR